MISYFSLPLLLTYTRIILSPLIAVMIINHYWLYAFIAFAVAALTDMLDGYCARLLGQQTIIGAHLDPLADKCLVLTTLCALSYAHIQGCSIPDWFLILLSIKEILLIFGTVYLALALGPQEIQPSLLAKITTGLQVISILVWCFGCFMHYDVQQLTHAMVISLSVLNIACLVQYGYVTWWKIWVVN